MFSPSVYSTVSQYQFHHQVYSTHTGGINLMVKTLLLFLINIFTLLIKEVVSVVFKHTFFSLRSMVSSLHHYECENFRTVFLRKSTINLDTCPVPGTNNLQMLSEKKKKKTRTGQLYSDIFPGVTFPLSAICSSGTSRARDCICNSMLNCL